MRKAMMIAYDYPPRGWSGAQRTVKFVRYLPDFGWQPIVLAPREWYLPAPTDAAMAAEVVHAPTERTGMVTHERFMDLWRDVGTALWPLTKLMGKDGDWFAEGMRWRYINWLCPDYAAGWIVPAVRRGLAMIRRHRPKVLYATAPPHSTLVTGRILSWLTGVPLVVDFRDLWMDEPNRPPLPAWRNRADAALERRVVTGAARIINVTQMNTRTLAAKYPEVPALRFVTIFNGYDVHDLATPAAAKKEKLRMSIRYIGSLYGKRTPVHVVRALEMLRAENPAVAGQVRLRLVGHVGEFEKELRESPAAEMIEVTGDVGHDAATREMADADVLLLIINSGGEGILTGKIFEYIASGPPVLATVPMRGEAAALLRRVGGATVVEFADVVGIKDALARLHGQWLDGGLKADRDPDAVRQFERRELTRRLAEVFDECAKRG
jgi:glycosyltransferase involved in cell wall biosynthesis